MIRATSEHIVSQAVYCFIHTHIYIYIYIYMYIYIYIYIYVCSSWSGIASASRQHVSYAHLTNYDNIGCVARARVLCR